MCNAHTHTCTGHQGEATCQRAAGLRWTYKGVVVAGDKVFEHFSQQVGACVNMEQEPVLRVINRTEEPFDLLKHPSIVRVDHNRQTCGFAELRMIFPRVVIVRFVALSVYLTTCRNKHGHGHKHRHTHTHGHGHNDGHGHTHGC